MDNKNITYNAVFFVLGVILCFLLLERCGSSKIGTVDTLPLPTSDTTFVHDTTYIDYPVVKWYPIPNDPIAEIPVAIIDTNACKFDRVYTDSLITDEISIYSKDSVNGYLLGSEITYKLATDTIIDTTTTIRDSIPYAVKVPSNGFYVNGGLGISPDGVKTVLIGVDYNTKKKIGFGYQFDIIRLTHNATIRWRLSR